MTGHTFSQDGHTFRVGDVGVIERNRIRADHTGCLVPGSKRAGQAIAGWLALGGPGRLVA